MITYVKLESNSPTTHLYSQQNLDKADISITYIGLSLTNSLYIPSEHLL